MLSLTLHSSNLTPSNNIDFLDIQQQDDWAEFVVNVALPIIFVLQIPILTLAQKTYRHYTEKHSGNTFDHESYQTALKIVLFGLLIAHVGSAKNNEKATSTLALQADCKSLSKSDVEEYIVNLKKGKNVKETEDKIREIVSGLFDIELNDQKFSSTATFNDKSMAKLQQTPNIKLSDSLEATSTESLKGQVQGKIQQVSECFANSMDLLNVLKKKGILSDQLSKELPMWNMKIRQQLNFMSRLISKTLSDGDLSLKRKMLIATNRQLDEFGDGFHVAFKQMQELIESGSEIDSEEFKGLYEELLGFCRQNFLPLCMLFFCLGGYFARNRVNRQAMALEQPTEVHRNVKKEPRPRQRPQVNHLEPAPAPVSILPTLVPENLKIREIEKFVLGTESKKEITKCLHNRLYNKEKVNTLDQVVLAIQSKYRDVFQQSVNHYRDQKIARDYIAKELAELYFFDKSEEYREYWKNLFYNVLK